MLAASMMESYLPHLFFALTWAFMNFPVME